jgi:phosphoglycolate phosphatase-like HAD superfamily hydrolase
MAKQNLFLDFDGVLVDSNSIKTQAFSLLATEFFGVEAAVALVSHHIQNPRGSRFTKLEWLVANHGVKKPRIDITELELQFSALVLSKIQSAKRTSSLASLLGKANLHAHILSAAPALELNYLVSVFEWQGLFESRIYGSPESKVSHLQRLGKSIDLKNSIFVGDASTDFDVALQFEMPFAFVSDWSDWRPSAFEQGCFLGSWPRLEDFLGEVDGRS